MLHRATQFAARNWSIPVEDLELSIEPIGGGLESPVVRAAFRSSRAIDLRHSSFVVKELRGLQDAKRRSTANCGPDQTPRQLCGCWKSKPLSTLTISISTRQLSNPWPWKQIVTSAAGVGLWRGCTIANRATIQVSLTGITILI